MRNFSRLLYDPNIDNKTNNKINISPTPIMFCVVSLSEFFINPKIEKISFNSIFILEIKGLK